MTNFRQITATSIVQAFLELKANKLRTFLSLLGITIGIFCIISVLTVLDSLKNSIQKDMATLGSDGQQGIGHLTIPCHPSTQQVKATKTILTFNTTVPGCGAKMGRSHTRLTRHLRPMAGLEEPGQCGGFVAPLGRLHPFHITACCLHTHGRTGQSGGEDEAVEAGEAGNDHRRWGNVNSEPV